MIYEYDFLDDNQLKQMLSLFNSGKFVDGARTGSKDKFIKDNKQQDDYDLNKMANTAIAKILKKSPIYHYHPLTKISPCMMLKYEMGQHYSGHVDYWEMWGSRTDYTAVITLNDDYEGGEHFIEIGPETIEKKLKPGKILIYQTDFVHGVRPVTDGVRKCITFWLQSAIPDPTMRYYITEFNKIYDKIQDIAKKSDLNEEDYQTLVTLDLVRCGIVKRSIMMK